MDTASNAPKILIGKKEISYFLVGLLIFGIWLGLRMYAFWLPHWKGDQGHYISLAMKLGQNGSLDDYNLRGVKIRFMHFNSDPVSEYVSPAPAPAGDEGDILRLLKTVGQSYYDEPLHMRAPLLSYMLIFSHQLFRAKGEPFMVLSSNPGTDVLEKRTWRVFKIQFWASIVPLFFNLLLTATVFWLGVRFFGMRTAAYATLLLILNPVSLMTSYRVLSEDLVVFLISAAVLAYLAAVPGRRWAGIVIAGVLMGWAVLAKQSAGLIFVPIAMHLFFLENKGRHSPREMVRALLNPYVLVLAVVAAAACAFWFLKVYQIYGNFLSLPGEAMKESVLADKTGWFRALSRRPHPSVFFSLGVLMSAPVLTFLVLTFKTARAEGLALWHGRESHGRVFFLWMWVVVFYFWVAQPWNLLSKTFCQEHRYFYPAYPALMLLSGLGLRKCYDVLKQRGWKPLYAEIAVMLVIVASAALTLPEVFTILFDNKMLY